MGRFVNDSTKVVVTVDDSKDERFADGWSPADADGKSTKAPAKKAASSKSEK